MDIEDLTATIRSKLSGPVFFPFVLAVVAINWKAIYFLLSFEASSTARMRKFEELTSFWSLLFWPALLAGGLVVFGPYLKWLVSVATKKARVEKRKTDSSADLDVEEHRMARQVKLAEARLKIAQANKQAESVSSEIEDPELRKATGEALTVAKNIDSFTENFDRGLAGLPNLADLSSELKGSEWLKKKSAQTFLEARNTAQKDGRKIFVVVYDSRKRESGKLSWAADNFFDFDAVRGPLLQHFVIVTSDIKDEKRFENAVNLELGSPIYLIISPDSNEIVESGRLYANPDEAAKMVQKWVSS